MVRWIVDLWWWYNHLEVSQNIFWGGSSKDASLCQPLFFLMQNEPCESQCTDHTSRNEWTASLLSITPASLNQALYHCLELYWAISNFFFICNINHSGSGWMWCRWFIYSLAKMFSKCHKLLGKPIIGCTLAAIEAALRAWIRTFKTVAVRKGIHVKSCTLCVDLWT